MRHAGNVQGGGACECPRGGGCFSNSRRVDDVTRAMSKGGGVLVNVQEGGVVFQFPGGWMTSRGQCPRGGACECPRGGGGCFCG